MGAAFLNEGFGPKPLFLGRLQTETLDLSPIGEQKALGRDLIARNLISKRLKKLRLVLGLQFKIILSRREWASPARLHQLD